MYPNIEIPLWLKKLSVLTLTSTLFGVLQAQTTYIPFGSETYNLLDRIETRSGKLSTGYISSQKALPRKGIVAYLESQRENARTLHLSRIDRYNIDRTISVNGEWASNGDGAENSKRPWFNTFYKKKADFVHVNTKDFFLVVNPVISASVISEKSNSKTRSKWGSARGLEIRGRIANKLGFYTFVTENQEQVPDFVAANTSKTRGLPGVDFYSVKGKHYDYLAARGYIDFEAIKNHLQITLGYDRHFIGDGMRSLLLSDFSAGSSFLRVQSRLGKFTYQNLYLELTPQFSRNGSDKRIPRKYATIHYLTYNATPWLNIGVFESTVYAKKDQYNPAYLIPIIFYNTLAHGLDNPDNVNIGFTFKAIALKHFQFYGQFLLDNMGSSWNNKYGIQLGGKYFDAFTVKNLDLQGEINMVRPYTYTTHSNGVSNYTHYHQPLATPLGAGFMEVLGVARYQPARDFFITLKGMYYIQGADTGSSNYGSNVLLNSDTRTLKKNVGMIHGVKRTVMLMNLNLSYMLRENLFIDVGATHRSDMYDKKIVPSHTTSYFYAGFRLNIARRDYDFY